MVVTGLASLALTSVPMVRRRRLPPLPATAAAAATATAPPRPCCVAVATVACGVCSHTARATVVADVTRRIASLAATLCDCVLLCWQLSLCRRRLLVWPARNFRAHKHPHTHTRVRTLAHAHAAVAFPADAYIALVSLFARCIIVSCSLAHFCAHCRVCRFTTAHPPPLPRAVLNVASTGDACCDCDAIYFARQACVVARVRVGWRHGPWGDCGGRRRSVV